MLSCSVSEPSPTSSDGSSGPKIRIFQCYKMFYPSAFFVQAPRRKPVDEHDRHAKLRSLVNGVPWSLLFTIRSAFRNTHGHFSTMLKSAGPGPSRARPLVAARLSEAELFGFSSASILYDSPLLEIHVPIPSVVCQSTKEKTSRRAGATR